MRLCFGSRRLWRKQHDLEANGYASREEWLKDWREARSDEFFVLGSRDETAGCQLCVATVADDGTLTLRLRLPDCLANQHGKYLFIQGVRFAYGHEQMLAALGSLLPHERMLPKCQHFGSPPTSANSAFLTIVDQVPYDSFFKSTKNGGIP